MQTQPNADLSDDSAPETSPYTCIKCQLGPMRPAVEEGEPEYTEQYICQQCGFHDSIPTLPIIASQMFSAIVGIAICLYLILNHASFLGQSAQLTGAQILQHFALILVSMLFVAGFVYVLYQSFKGTAHRRAYIQSSIRAPLTH